MANFPVWLQHASADRHQWQSSQPTDLLPYLTFEFFLPTGGSRKIRLSPRDTSNLEDEDRDFIEAWLGNLNLELESLDDDEDKFLVKDRADRYLAREKDISYVLADYFHKDEISLICQVFKPNILIHLDKLPFPSELTFSSPKVFVQVSEPYDGDLVGFSLPDGSEEEKLPDKERSEDEQEKEERRDGRIILWIGELAERENVSLWNFC